jgi:phenylalanyl-tRNA synthetase beta chain
VRRSLAALGYQETINFSFVEERWEHELAANPDPIKLLNPITSQMSVMRSSLVGSLLQVLKFNLDRKAAGCACSNWAGCFCAMRLCRTPTPPWRVSPAHACCWLGLRAGRCPAVGVTRTRVDFFDIKGDVEALLAPLPPVFEVAEHPAMHPGRCAVCDSTGQVIGHVGELHPRWRQGYDLAQAPVMFELDLEAVLHRPVPVFAAPWPNSSRWQRDIAVVVREG